MSKVSPIDLRLGALINMTMFATSYNIFKLKKDWVEFFMKINIVYY